MNSFQNFVNYIFKITEAYELDESYEDEARLKIGTITKHLLRAFQRLNTDGEDWAKNAIREIEQKFLPQLNYALEQLPQGKEIVRSKVINNWSRELLDALVGYDKFYSKDPRLYPRTSQLAVNLEVKIAEDSLEFEDLGLVEDLSNKKKLQFRFDFNVAIQRNKGDEEVVEKKKTDV